MEELREMSLSTDEEEREPAEERGEMCESTRIGLDISTLGAKEAGVSTHVTTLFLPSFLPLSVSQCGRIPWKRRPHPGPMASIRVNKDLCCQKHFLFPNKLNLLWTLEESSRVEDKYQTLEPPSSAPLPKHPGLRCLSPGLLWPPSNSLAATPPPLILLTTTRASFEHTVLPMLFSLTKPAMDPHFLQNKARADFPTPALQEACIPATSSNSTAFQDHVMTF